MRTDLGSIQADHGVIPGAGIGAQRAPVRHRAVPVGAGGRHGTTLQVGDGGFVDGDHASARAGLDGHVADGHPAFHGQRTNGRTAKLDGVAGTAGGADAADDGQYDVLGGDAAGQRAVDLDQHALHLLGDQALRGEHMLHLGGTDTEGQTAEGTVGAGVGVTADHGHAGQRGALLRANHVDDALTRIPEREIGGDAELADVAVQRDHLLARGEVFDALDAPLPAGGGRVVVGGGHDRRGAPRLAPGDAQPLEGLRAGHFVHQVAIDVDQAGAVFLAMNEVVVPELVVERACGERHEAWGGGQGPRRVGLPEPSIMPCEARGVSAGRAPAGRAASRVPRTPRDRESACQPTGGYSSTPARRRRRHAPSSATA